MKPTLRALLVHAKKPDADFTWKGVSTALVNIYQHELDLEQVIQVLYGAYVEAFMEPRFEMGHLDGVTKILLAPLNGSNSLGWPKTPLGKSFPVEEFYNSMVKLMMGDLMLARVDWCADLLQPTAV